MCLCVCSVALSRPILCDTMDCSLPGSSVHGILQARMLEWVAISYSRDLPDPGIKPELPASPVLAGGFFTAEPLGSPDRGLFRTLCSSSNLPQSKRDHSKLAPEMTLWFIGQYGLKSNTKQDILRDFI